MRHNNPLRTVVPLEGGWTFKHQGGEPEGQFSTERDADHAAKEYARSHGDWEVVIQDRHGRIRDSDTYGPRPGWPRPRLGR